MRSRILLLAAVLGLACNGESPTEPRPGDAPPQAVFQGYTIDPQGNRVARVTVSLIGPGDAVAAATSDGDGAFRFAAVVPGTYFLKIRPEGGEEQSAGRVLLMAGVNTHYVLVSTCRVPYGSVRDSLNGHPIAGAKVTIFNRETLTDSAGYYRIDFGCDFVSGSTIVMRAEHGNYHPSETLTRASGLCTCSYDFLLKRR